MHLLKYETIENSQPQGKPRVYFSAHPEDCFFLNEIKEDIFATHNCAIFYIDAVDEQSIDYNELFYQISEMQLFVFPVTKKFLNSDNRCRLKELPFAIDNHIPILPIIIDPDAIPQFNTICGDIQTIFKSEDNTVINYKRKLKAFLDSVLIGDELIQAVKSTFDGHIFLSYRKKDRKNAQALMGFVHKNEKLQSFSIWYDEFLVPGEKFNYAISENLKHSDCFLLVVTPNILEITNNKKNYIMDIEYPLAKKMNATIIPVEMEDTDAELINKYYPGMPQTISGQDEEGITNNIAARMPMPEVRKEVFTPRKNYLLGLAYLNGVDVEVDYQLAIKFLESAAKENHPYAMERLVTVFQNGQGVNRNLNIALQWQENLVNYWARVCQKHPQNEDYKRSYWHALFSWGNFYMDTGNPEKAEAQFKKMLDIINFDDYGRALAFRGLGDAADELGYHEKGRELNLKVLDIARKSFTKEQNQETYRQLYSAVGHQGNFGKTKEETITLYREAVDICQKRIDLYGDKDSRFDYIDIAGAYCGHVLQYYSEDKIRLDALNILENAIRIGEELIKREEYKDEPVMLTNLYNFLTRVYSQYTNYSNKEKKVLTEYRMRCLELLEMSYSMSSTITNWIFLANNYLMLSRELDNPDEAFLLLEKAENILNLKCPEINPVIRLREILHQESLSLRNKSSQDIVFLFELQNRTERNKETAAKENSIAFKQKESWKRLGKCQYCGHEFKGFWGNKCSNCGRKKDYK